MICAEVRYGCDGPVVVRLKSSPTVNIIIIDLFLDVGSNLLDAELRVMVIVLISR